MQGSFRDELLWVCGLGTLGQGLAFRAGPARRLHSQMHTPIQHLHFQAKARMGS